MTEAGLHWDLPEVQAVQRLLAWLHLTASIGQRSTYAGPSLKPLDQKARMNLLPSTLMLLNCPRHHHPGETA